MCDDACLVWPDADGIFRAAPLPTWSTILGINERLPTIGTWRVNASNPITDVCILRKAEHDDLVAVEPLRAVQPIYQALSEHPQMISTRDPYRKQLFTLASTMARSVQVWQLNLTRHGSYWQILTNHTPL